MWTKGWCTGRHVVDRRLKFILLHISQDITNVYILKINKLDILELLLSPPNISSSSNLLDLKDQNNERPISFFL